MNPGDESAKAPPSSLIFRPNSFFERLDLSRYFAPDKPLDVELGAGDGSFLIEYARRHPERNFLGVERLLGRLRKIDRKGRRAGLVNLRLLRIEAAYFLQYMLPEVSVDALHIYFPDPWPKRRHWKYRLINDAFTRHAARALKPRGCIYLRTDHGEYFAQMREVFGAAKDFEEIETPEELAEVTTDFERQFEAEGKGANRAAYRARRKSNQRRYENSSPLS